MLDLERGIPRIYKLGWREKFGIKILVLGDKTTVQWPIICSTYRTSYTITAKPFNLLGLKWNKGTTLKFKF